VFINARGFAYSRNASSDGLPAMHPAAIGVNGFFFFGGDDIFASAFTNSPQSSAPPSTSSLIQRYPSAFADSSSNMVLIPM
jgi:hypothetical protein